MAAKLDCSKIKTGELIAMVNWVRVTKVDKKGTVILVADQDHAALNNIEVKGKELVEACFSAAQFTKEEKVTMTRAAEILISAYNRPISVCFTKQDGTERVLEGRLICPEPLLGRSKMEDLSLPATEHRMRLVDHRTVKWLIVDGIKYTVK